MCWSIVSLQTSNGAQYVVGYTARHTRVTKDHFYPAIKTWFPGMTLLPAPYRYIATLSRKYPGQRGTIHCTLDPYQYNVQVTPCSHAGLVLTTISPPSGRVRGTTRPSDVPPDCSRSMVVGEVMVLVLWTPPPWGVAGVPYLPVAVAEVAILGPHTKRQPVPRSPRARPMYVRTRRGVWRRRKPSLWRWRRCCRRTASAACRLQRFLAV